MIIIHKIDNFLFNLFPKTNQAGKSDEILKEELIGYYTFGRSEGGEDRERSGIKLQEPAGQMAVTMYCLSALQYFHDKDLEEIKKVGFEIAMLGRQGIDPAKTDKKYHLESIPEKEFTGLQLLVYMYAAFQVIDPVLDTGLNFKREYETAKEMRKGKV